jgi:hypothetical protein
MDRIRQEDDVIHDVNRTTLGPYSFHVFVSAAWTELHTGGMMPKGRRPLQLAGKSHFKRPLAVELKKVGVREQRKRKQMHRTDENTIPEQDGVEGSLLQRKTRARYHL